MYPYLSRFIKFTDVLTPGVVEVPIAGETLSSAKSQLVNNFFYSLDIVVFPDVGTEEERMLRIESAQFLIDSRLLIQ